MLPPCRSMIDFKYYQSDHIEYVINMASEMFDVVIVDAGWYPHNNLYFAALNATPNKYMVTTQQQSSLSNHLQIKHQVLDEYGVTSRKSDRDKGNAADNILLIGNKVNEDLGTNIFKEYDMVFAVSLPYIPLVYQAESERKSLRNIYRNYDKQLDKLTNLVALQIEYKLTQKKKSKGFFGFGGKNE